MGARLLLSLELTSSHAVRTKTCRQAPRSTESPTDCYLILLLLLSSGSGAFFLFPPAMFDGWRTCGRMTPPLSPSCTRGRCPFSRSLKLHVNSHKIQAAQNKLSRSLFRSVFFPHSHRVHMPCSRQLCPDIFRMALWHGSLARSPPGSEGRAAAASRPHCLGQKTTEDRLRLRRKTAHNAYVSLRTVSIANLGNQVETVCLLILGPKNLKPASISFP